ncbi:hypothetical protein ABTX60_27520 [Streptomyces sp. NPDC126510]|uniref:hypothetical protein n=1 Tax=Streptomyces sp. NPDC126510 TaxID=3155317 RepID=UPI00332BE153
MNVPTVMREADRRLAKRPAAGASPALNRVPSLAEEAAEETKLWCGAAAVMAAPGCRRGRKLPPRAWPL